MLSVLAGITGGSLFVCLGISMMKFGTDRPLTARFWGIETGFLVFLLGIFFPLAFWYTDILAKQPHLFRKRIWAYPGIVMAVNYGIVVPFLLVLAMFPQYDFFDLTRVLQTGKYIVKFSHIPGPNILGYVLTFMIIAAFSGAGMALLRYSWKLLSPNYGQKGVQFFQKG